jgi:hypothetical protein
MNGFLEYSQTMKKTKTKEDTTFIKPLKIYCYKIMPFEKS